MAGVSKKLLQQCSRFSDGSNAQQPSISGLEVDELSNFLTLTSGADMVSNIDDDLAVQF